MKKVIVADASPIIALGSINQLSILFKLFGKVIIPEAVAQECLVDISRPGAIAIAKAIETKKIQVSASVELERFDEALLILDKGEADAITLASSLNLPLVPIGARSPTNF
jgi:predicted nucleic acid-binding protein